MSSPGLRIKANWRVVSGTLTNIVSVFLASVVLAARWSNVFALL